MSLTKSNLVQIAPNAGWIGAAAQAALKRLRIVHVIAARSPQGN